MNREDLPAWLASMILLVLVVSFGFVDFRAGVFHPGLLYPLSTIFVRFAVTIILPAALGTALVWIMKDRIEDGIKKWLLLPASVVVFAVSAIALEYQFKYQIYSVHNAIYYVCVSKKMQPQCSTYARTRGGLIKYMPKATQDQVFSAASTP